MLGPALLVMLFANSIADLPPGAVMRLGDPRWRAGGEVRHLRFSADGETLSAWVTRSDGRLRAIAWDAATGKLVAPFPEPSPSETPEGTIPAVRLSQDRVLTAGPGSMGRVWDTTTARQLAQLRGHTGDVTAVALSAGKKRIATGSADGLVRVWDAETFRPISEPCGHTAVVRSIRVSTDGKRAVTTGGDGTARIWDLNSGKELRAFNVPGPVEFTADGLGLVTSGKNGDVRVRDILTGAEMVPTQTPRRPRFCDGDASIVRTDTFANQFPPFVVSPNEKMQATAGRGGFGLHERATWETRRVIGLESPILALAFTPDGTRLLTAGDDHTVLVWDMRLQAVPLPEAVRRETNAGKLWARMCVGKADEAFIAMARLAAEPDAAVKTARMRLRPADEEISDSPEQRVADARAIELIESLGTPEAREFLKHLSTGEASAFRTQEAKRALERLRM